MRSLILKDLIRRWRSPIPTLVMLLFPFVMTLIIGAFSSGGDDGDGFPSIRMLLLDRDDSVVSNFLVDATGNEELADRVQVVKVGEEGFELMKEGDASAMVVIPDGFQDAVFKGERCELLVVRNPAEAIKPEIVEQGVEVLATYADQAGHLLGPSLDELATMMEAERWPTKAAILALSEGFFDQFQHMDRFVFPPVVEIVSIDEEGEEESAFGGDFNLFGYLLVMVSVMSVLFVSSRAIYDLFEEEQSGMLRRQLATPIGLGRLISAKLLFAVLFGMLVMFFLLLAGAGLGWYDWPVDLLGLLFHTAAFSLAASGLLTVIFALTRTERQAGILSWLVIMGMSAIGGSFFPTQFMPGGMQTVSHFTLNHWAIQGYLELMVEHVSVAGMVRNSLVLLAVGAVTILLGRVLLVRRFQGVA